MGGLLHDEKWVYLFRPPWEDDECVYSQLHVDCEPKKEQKDVPENN